MAFTTRSGRTAAIGTGSLTTSLVLMAFSLVLLTAPLAVALGFATWFVAPVARAFVEDQLPGALAVGIAAVGLQLVLRAGMAACFFVCFVGPAHRLRDSFAAARRSRTAWFASIALLLSIALAVVMRFPFGDPRPVAVIVLIGLLLTFDVLTARGLFSIARVSRASAFYEGMSEAEKRVADRPWPTSRRPSFADPAGIESEDDARRYERRANDAAELHVWIGAGIIVIFTAFIGTSLSASWADPGPASVIPVSVVIGFSGLGFWIQRRSRAYRSLAQDFARRAAELALQRETAEAAEAAEERTAGRLSRWIARRRGRPIGIAPRGDRDASSRASSVSGRGGRRQRRGNAAAGAPTRTEE